MANLLIIDDDSSMIQQLTELVGSFGHIPESSMYPKYLMEILEHQPTDLILMDMHMPDMDGLTLLSQLKANPKYQHLPVIMLTADTDESLLARCLQAGAHDFINKPVNRVTLRARIESALNVKQLIEQLRHMNHQLKSIFEGMAEGVVTLDESYHIHMISQKAAAMLDVAEEEAPGKPAAAILGAPIAGPSGVLLTTSPGTQTQTRLLCPSGASVPVTLTVTALDTNVTGAAWLLAFRDRREDERRSRERGGHFRFGRMVSGDPAMDQVFQRIDKIAHSSATVLIRGDSGTGKEMVAREIHDRGRRAQKPFHAVNCGAIPAELMESEFFGHERGAFTGAHQAKPGHFEMADGGTLFLDEIAEIPLPLQSKLLRVLQERSLRRVGGTRDIKVDVRILSATLKNLEDLVARGSFREDLYYRLHVVDILLPPLRERISDIPYLVETFIRELNRREDRRITHLANDAMQILLSQFWPGNIRELHNVIEHAFAVSTGPVLQTAHLPDRLHGGPGTSVQATPAKPRSEKETIQHALEQAGFNKGKAAALLGVSPATLYRKRKKYGI